MSTIKVDTILSENTPTVNFTDGVNVSGVATAHTILANNANISGVTTATGGFKVGTAATITSTGNATYAGIVTATSFASGGKAFPCYEFSSWYVNSEFDPASADCFIENWAESNGGAYARLGTAPSYSSGVWTPSSAGYWKMTAMVVYFHSTATNDSGAHAIRVSTNSGGAYANVSTTGFRISSDTHDNIKRTTVVCASFKVVTAATFRMGVYGIGVNADQFRYMGGSQVDAGGCSLLIEKVAEIET